MGLLKLIASSAIPVVCVMGLDALAPGDEIPAAYFARHKKHVPSPQELADTFRNKQRAKESLEKAKKNYLHSPEFRIKLMRDAHIAYQHARLNNTHEGVLPSDTVHRKCGSKVSIKASGLKEDPAVFLQDNGGPSMAEPGSGAVQVLKDEGRSKMGTIAKAEDGHHEEPYFRVYKDGYSFSLCAKDSMYDFGDKYGFNKDQFKEANNVSIVRYEEVVLKENQAAMMPRKCYEFCRSVPNMVYFGIRGGSHCYCMPFFKKAASGSENCDIPCPGDPVLMCGGKEKSQIFEMHLCQDTAGDLLYGAVNAEIQLVYFYDTAFMTQKFAEHLETIGGDLKKIAGGGGDPGASDLAQLAIKSAASLNDPNTGWGACKGDYVKLLDDYEANQALYEDSDFTFAKELQKAEDAIRYMDGLQRKLKGCAKESEGPILEVYPFYHDIMAALDAKQLQTSLDRYGDEVVGFVPVLYKIKPDDRPEFNVMSSCAGEPLGRPMPLKLPGCAMACDLLTNPRCVGFQYFQMMDGDEQKPLCFLFKEVKTIRSYRCNRLQDSLIEKNAVTIGQKAASASVGGFSSFGLRGSAKGSSNSTLSNALVCGEVAKLQKYSGLSCQSLWGKESEWIQRCPQECEAAPDGHKHTAVCMYRDSLNPPMVTPKGFRKCFGAGNEPADQTNADFRIVEFGMDASGGAGPKIEGDITMGNYVVKEPYGYVWTPGPAGQR
eukprot:gnl/MRDRNA2_/MRDRNA2_105055_c0_seq1.p1 gnl/MRDRNA2_/MRDRNA2_105055_c0~~gnl/MRDRNA2_/MRDRNA2_105055_c0_seq1.p1  ORF type:complete len:715 (+),score=144.01 gnl/MRDRNA2_/MRDRNA2_105055_c0_seq1:168-2312(+)